MNTSARSTDAPTSRPVSPWAIEAEDLARRFGPVEAIAGVSLLIRQGEFFSLLGPSGCGKTTLLRIIAGLDLPDRGILRIAGVDSLRIPAHHRPVNTVFQSYALFPHLSVQENVAFGLRMKRVPAPELTRRVRHALDLVEIAPLAGRKPAQLSGGQKQRVALARALVNEPQVLLLDEPLGALDLRLRRQLQVDLRALQRRLGITFIHVTHDQEEALSMSDRIAVMQAGRIAQVATPPVLYENPRTRFVAQFLGSCNLLEGPVIAREPTAARLATPLGAFWVQLPPATPSPASDRNLSVAIRPERIQLRDHPTPSAENAVRAVVQDRVYTGSAIEYLLTAAGQVLRATVLNPQAHHPFPPGSEVVACLPRSALIVLED